MRYSVAFFALATMVAAPAFGGGFSVSEQSGKATAQGGAVTATVSDSSAMFYNLAGLTKVKGLHLTIGSTVALTRYTAEQDVAGDRVSFQSNNPAGIVPVLYAAYELDDEFTLGFSFYNAWGSAVYLPLNATNSAGETVQNPQADLARKTILKTPTASFGVGWDLGERIEGLAVGASIDVMMASIYSYRNLYFGDDLAKVELGAKALAIGPRFGFMYDSPDYEGLSVGFSVKMPMTLNFEGQANFDSYTQGASEPDYRGALPPDGDASGSLTLPLNINFGVADTYMDGKLRVSMEAVLLNYEVYKELRFVLPDGSEAASAKNWKNTLSVRTGLQYTLTEDLFLRAGYVFDTNPVPASTLNSSLIDMDRHFLTTGMGATFGAVTVDFAAMYKLPGERWSNTKRGEDLSRYEFDILVFAVHVGYQMDFGDGASAEEDEES